MLRVSRRLNQRFSRINTEAKPATSFCWLQGVFRLFAPAMLLLMLVASCHPLWGMESSTAPAEGTHFLDPPMDISPMGPTGGSSTVPGTGAGESPAPGTASTLPPAASPPGSTPAASPPAAVQEVKPEQIYIRDVDGSLKLMLGWTMSQFEELVRLRDGLEQRNQAPPYLIEEIHAQGKVIEEYAELAIRVRIRLRVDQPCRVPLRLEQLVLQELPQRGNDQPLLFSFNRQDGGYLLYLQGSADTVEEVVFRGWVPIGYTGNEARLVLSLPDSPLSDLELDFPAGNIEPSVTPGATILGMEPVEGGQRLKVTGLGPGFVLSWGVSSGASSDWETVLESNGVILARVTENAVDFDARLTVRSYGAPFDRFRVSLPPGASVIPFSSNSYSVQEVSVDSREKPSQGDRSLAEVVLVKKTTGPVEVRLTAQVKMLGDTWADLGGFSVEGAVLQHGYLTVIPSSDLALVWGEWRGVRQVSQAPTSGNGEPSEGAVYFEYFTQPCKVQMKTVRRVAYVRIAPRYRVGLSFGKAELQGRLSYEVRGAELTTLDVDMANWQLEKAFLGEQGAALAITGDPQGRVTLALPQGMSGRFEITFVATRNETLDKPPLVMSFPQPKGHAVQPAEVLVVAPANLELRTDYEQSQGLEPTSVQPREGGTATVNVVSFRLNKPEASFVADWKVHQREIITEVLTRATWEGTQLAVEQKIRCQVRYEAWTGPWRFRIPSGIDQVSVLLDGRPVQLTRMTTNPSPQTESDETAPQPSSEGPQFAGDVFAVSVIGPVLGSSELVFRYTVSGGIRSAGMSRWQIPLVDPLDGQLQQHRLSVLTPATWHVDGVEPPWRLRETKSLSGVSLLQTELETTAHVAEAILSSHSGTTAEADVIVVERMLIQTRLDRLMRQDRCALRFFTKQDHLNLELPRGARSDLVQIWLDGRLVESRRISRTAVTIPLTSSVGGSGNSETGKGHLLELWYELPRFRHSWGRTNLECLRLDPQAIVQRVCWEIVLLPDEHIIWNGPEVTAEFRWGWTGFFWGRLPTVPEEDLERWAGVSDGWLHVSGRANRYLFGALRAVDSANIWCWRRPWIVGICSAAIVFAGLGLVYFGPLARKLVVLATLVVIMVLLLLRPDVALLAGQASALGLALAILALVLHRALSLSETAMLRANVWNERTGFETVICQRSPDAVAGCSDPVAAAERPTEVHR